RERQVEIREVGVAPLLGFLRGDGQRLELLVRAFPHCPNEGRGSGKRSLRLPGESRCRRDFGQGRSLVELLCAASAGRWPELRIKFYQRGRIRRSGRAWGRVTYPALHAA